jgi:hypothetical protein
MMGPQRIQHHVTKYNITSNNFVLNLRHIYDVIMEIKRLLFLKIHSIVILVYYINIDTRAAVNHNKLL